MSLFETIIMSLFDLTSYLIISSKLIRNETSFNIKRLIKIIFLMASLSSIMGVIGVSSFGKYSFIFGMLTSNIFIYFVYRKNLKETIYTYFISTVIILIIQYLALTILLVFNFDRSLDFEGGLLAQSIILPIIILIYKLVPLNLLFKFIEDKNRLFSGLILNMFIIVICILIYRYIEMERLLRNILVIAILSFGMLFVNLVIVKDGLRNEYEEKMLATYKKYLPIIDDLMKELRSRQHDFDNHIQAINMISVTSTDYESIVESMKRYIKDLDVDSEFRKLIKLDNKILAGFLYNKTRKAKECGISFQIDIKDYEFKTNVKDYELIEVLGNLIDNAFDTGVKNNCVILEIKEEKNMSVIEIKNKHSYLNSNTISKMFTPGYSTKSEKNHGYGLTNVKKIVSNNTGLLSVYNETIDKHNYIVFKVLLVRI
ncbi:GHKL domain-containing protein [Tissierella sp. Yu-01]|uniref:sensor histidine kinase n=1 Tax=Tissierella sp. Yu-01 TaxID=3035694 RepID=UPI00240E25D1|nr:GHKL domain-containing protein [Tissierella sp. Yu-01]WFA09984.1 GHKL domain-containing protein [Tissierella sp. Yu-01]